MRNLMTIVVPCYNEEEVLPMFMEAIAPIRDELSQGRAVPDNDQFSQNGPAPAGAGEASSLTETVTPCDTEIIFIDDGSKDGTLRLLKKFNAADPSVHYISFSRNFITVSLSCSALPSHICTARIKAGDSAHAAITCSGVTRSLSNFAAIISATCMMRSVISSNFIIYSSSKRI